MKDIIQQCISAALETLIADQVLANPIDIQSIDVGRTRDASHGDFACNIAMKLAKPAGLNPRDLAQKIVAALPAHAEIEKTAIAGPGFINFFVTKGVEQVIIKKIVEEADQFGVQSSGAGQKVQVEFVSANPTGPLHVGHGRGAAYGASVANLLTAAGYDVQREYYVNDAGRQMDILAASVWLRYLQQSEVKLTFPVNGYKGDYINDIASKLIEEHGSLLKVDAESIMRDVPADFNADDDSGDKEAHIDGIIKNAKSSLGNDKYDRLHSFGLHIILDDIRQDLGEFGVDYDEWFSEKSLMSSKAVSTAIDKLKASEHIYEKGGALWFKSSELGDEKDRVVQRDNGQPTYFASDIAYHQNKIDRGFSQVIDIWGADHHGYVPRVKAALTALGHDADERLNVMLVQFANLYKDGEKVAMTTRGGQFVTLRQLREDVGNDAARFFYVMRRHDQHMDFDLNLAKAQSNDNPVYYIQYAHARIKSMLKNVEGFEAKNTDLAPLDQEAEQRLMAFLSTYPELILRAAQDREPHRLANYLRELANLFHSYYNSHKVLLDDQPALRDARLALCCAIAQVIRNGLSLLGVSAPESM